MILYIYASSSQLLQSVTMLVTPETDESRRMMHYITLCIKHAVLKAIQRMNGHGRASERKKEKEQHICSPIHNFFELSAQHM